LFRVRNLLYGAAALALAMSFSPDAIRAALAASASAFFEATPFLFAGVLLSHLLRRRTRIAEYLGCGCGSGPSARSLPAAAATWVVFGPFTAIARYLAAALVASVIHRRSGPREIGDREPPHLLGELASVLPAALLAGAALQLCAIFDASRLSTAGNALLGAALGFTAAPCGLGAVALAGALRARAPVAALTFLCIAGIADVRTLQRSSHASCGHDAFAYVLLAIALAIVAWRHGDALVHPAFAAALACCACAALLCAVAYRRFRSGCARAAPALMLVGALVGAPPPAYHATETTLTDIFPGERVTFTGALTRDERASAVVRYAITCCRADAVPLALRLDRSPPYPAGTWLRVDGRIESVEGNLRLVPRLVERVAAPLDPFMYR
jgi:hypothetical protein